MRLPLRSSVPFPSALILLLAALVLGGCGSTATERSSTPGQETPRQESPGQETPGAAVEAGSAVSDPTLQEVRSEHGAISSASIWASEVGARVLAQGGNAADAAVAAAWALAVTEPSMSGLGGRSSILIRTAGGQVSGIDGLNQVPSSYRPDVAPEGYDRAAIPGVPAALARLHREHGQRPMEELLAPAIHLARDGFLLPEQEAARFAAAAEDLLSFSGESARGTYLQSDGTPWPAGTLFRQPALARTLQTLADEGVESFYRGSLAEVIDTDMRGRGGFITRDELAAYEALPARSVEGRYRGHTIVSNFRPASGHAVIQALQTLEAATPGAAPGPDTPAGRARWAALLGQVMGQAISDRGLVVDGSESTSAEHLTSLAHARQRAAELRIPDDAPPEEDGAALAGVLPKRAPGSWVPGELVTDPRDRESTTHMAVVDAQGMLVSLTQSLGPSMGTRVVAPELGFLYATRLGSTPGSRPGSTISPTVVLRPDDSLLIGLGGAGDARIISAVIQVVSRMVDHGMPLDRAMAAPRIHPDGELRLRIESGSIGSWSAPEQRLLERWGFEPVPTPAGYFGRVHAVRWDPVQGEAFGVAEPRWNGGVSAPAAPPR